MIEHFYIWFFGPEFYRYAGAMTLLWTALMFFGAVIRTYAWIEKKFLS